MSRTSLPPVAEYGWHVVGEHGGQVVAEYASPPNSTERGWRGWQV